MSTTSEQAVAVVRASVMIYDDGGKRWLPAGQSGQHAESKVQLFQHLRVSTYRIVARKGPEHEVVLNCPLYATMKYNQTTATFHQWRTEQRQLYGLNFVSQDDAQVFGQAVLRAVEAISLAASVGSAAPQQMPSQNDSNLIYSTVTPTNVAPSPSRPAPPVPPPPPPTPPAASKVPPAPPAPNGSVPPAPPPPPPPVPNGTSASNSMPKQPMNLAQAISNQKLRKVPSGAAQARPGAPSEEPGMNKDARSASVGSVDTTISTVRGGIGGGSHFDVMSEMAATLARRRLIAESGSATSSGALSNGADTTAADSPTRSNDKGPEAKQKPWESRNGSRPSLNDAQSFNTDSPKTHRKVPSGSSLSSQEDVGLSLMGGGAGAPAAIGQASRSLSNGPTSATTPVVVAADTLEQWKQEILQDVRREINKAKMEIIEALKAELNRR